jgi:hypothetical protein
MNDFNLSERDKKQSAEDLEEKNVKRFESNKNIYRLLKM